MIAALQPFGDVLQVGFGQKKAAFQIGACHPKTHTIIEGDPFLLQKAQEWIKEHPHVRLIADVWQQALFSLAVFDTIYCELREIGGLWPEFTRMRYCDRDLETFCDGVVKTAPEQLFRFLHELAHNGQITPEQLKSTLRKYQLSGTPPKVKKSCRQMVVCLKLCLETHMRPGSRFAAPLDDFSIALEDPLFLAINADPYVEIRECEGGIVVEKYGS